MKRKKILELDRMNQQQICYPAHDDEQQQHQQYSNTQSSSGSSSNLYVYRYIPSIIYQVLEVLGCETTHGARQKEK